MSSSNNSQPPPSSPFQGVSDIPNGRASHQGHSYNNINEYTHSGSYNPLNPMPHNRANEQVMMGMPHRVAGAVAHLANANPMSSAQIVNSMYHTDIALSHQRRTGGGPGGYGITNLSQQPFNAPGYDPTTVGEVFAEMPLSGSASARGNIASVGQMVQQAALYSSPHFGENIKRDLTEGFNYQLLTQPSV